MLEFVFFHPRPQQRFVAYLRERGIEATELTDAETLGIGIPEDIDDRLLDEIETFYDEMMALDQEIFEAETTEAGHQAAGVVLNLGSGETVYARVDSGLLGKVMQVLSAEELGELVNAIVDAVEHPDRRPLCQPDDVAG
jgi:hypothetical protein